MSDHVMKTIEQIVDEITKAEAVLKPKKSLANQLCQMSGVAPIYPEIDDPSLTPQIVIRRNAFYGRPLATCIKEILEMRVNLPVREATIDEIFASLQQGGYDLDASGDTEVDQKRGVSIALGKNSQTFHRVASGDYGLVEWYPNIREKRSGPPMRAPIRNHAPPTIPPATDPAIFTIEGGPPDL